jgi:type I restriction enzyme R subunit
MGRTYETARSRQRFSFPRPETLAEWVAQPEQLRGRLGNLPPLDEGRLWAVQARAIHNLEESFGEPTPVLSFKWRPGRTRRSPQ